MPSLNVVFATKSFEAIRNSSGNSFVHETESQVILNGSYNIGFTMDLALKDLGFALQMGRDFGVPLEVAGLVEQTFVRSKAQYGGSAWSSQVVKLLEDAVGTDLDEGYRRLVCVVGEPDGRIGRLVRAWRLARVDLRALGRGGEVDPELVACAVAHDGDREARRLLDQVHEVVEEWL